MHSVVTVMLELRRLWPRSGGTGAPDHGINAAARCRNDCMLRRAIDGRCARKTQLFPGSPARGARQRNARRLSARRSRREGWGGYWQRPEARRWRPWARDRWASALHLVWSPRPSGHAATFVSTTSIRTALQSTLSDDCAPPAAAQLSPPPRNRPPAPPPPMRTPTPHPASMKQLS
jgi:hypothetical protein